MHEYVVVITSPGLIIPFWLPGKMNLYCTIGQGSDREQNVQSINLAKPAGNSAVAVSSVVAPAFPWGWHFKKLWLLSEGGLLDWTTLISMCYLYGKKELILFSKLAHYWQVAVLSCSGAVMALLCQRKKTCGLITLRDWVGKGRPSKVEVQSHSFESLNLILHFSV